MRLAETYLDRAEAYIQLGEMQKAADDINKVRARANAKPVAASEVSIDYLLTNVFRIIYGRIPRSGFASYRQISEYLRSITILTRRLRR